MLVCSEIKILLTGCWWLVCSERKYCWLVADKPNEQGDYPLCFGWTLALILLMR
jgi:hypothetical protein